MLSSCPLCHVDISSLELEWHVNNHLMEDECQKDAELAQQLALAPPSPGLLDKPTNRLESSCFPTKNLESCSSSFNHTSLDYTERTDKEKISCLIGLQTRSPFYRIEGGLMVLLRRCLEFEIGNSRSVISGHVDHYQSIKSEDAGFGCGWRNIQMLSSHLLMLRQETRDVMFGGSGFVPDIPSLQRWLEIAWESGFDRIGSDSFDNKIYGSRKWIGTTECATLFRSFGLRARIVDFDAMCYSIKKQPMQQNKKQCGGKGKVERVCGPMDKFVLKKRCKDSQVGPSSSQNSQQEHYDPANSILPDNGGCNPYNGKINNHQVLIDWIWKYFTCNDSCRLDYLQHVQISDKTPLYFQHQGHSRTIVGIQVQKEMNGFQDRYSLLVLDPGQRTADLERSLRNGSGWQKMIKRGVHTLRKSQYQLCYVDPGVAHEEEVENLKTIESILVES